MGKYERRKGFAMGIFFRTFVFALGILLSADYVFAASAENSRKVKSSLKNSVPADVKANFTAEFAKNSIKSKKIVRSQVRKELKNERKAGGSILNDVPVDLSVFETSAVVLPANEIDAIVESLHLANFVRPSAFCSDAVFVRRVFVDLTGTIPDAAQSASFIDDKSPDKRAKLVDALLSSPEFSDYWALKFGDILRIKAEFPVNLWPNAAQAYDRFLRECIRNRVPYNIMVRRMLTASGSNFRVGEVNFYRAMQSREPSSIAASAALSFMGMRFEKLPEEKRDNLAKFFSRLKYKSTKEWKEEVVVNDISKRAAFQGELPDGWKVNVGAEQDPRAVFADWLTAKKNPYFSRAFANRVWTWIFGTPIVSPADDMFTGNAAVCPQLLGHLAQYFEDSNFDIRALFRHIALSRTYSRSFIPSGDAAKCVKLFACYPVRRFDAEVVIDALNKITDTTEIYSSTTPEPYTTLPDWSRAIQLPDGSITTSFLELFGKPARDTGTMSERNNNPNSSQKLYMVNSSHIKGKLVRSKKLQSLMWLDGRKTFDSLYLTFLSRRPSEAELAALSAPKRNWNYMCDVIWTLANTEEFINRH